jgi:hypothetical protein
MTSPVKFLSFQDGPTITVNDMMKNPTWIPQTVLNMMTNQFIGDELLRQGPSAQSGAVVWREPTPLFGPYDQEIVAEYAEIPGAENLVGGLYAMHTTKRGLAVKISQEMRDRNEVGVLRDYMEQVSNTIIRSWDKLFFNALTSHPGVQTFASTGSWFTGTTVIRADIANALYMIADAKHSATDPDSRYGYVGDTLLINQLTASEFLDSDEVNMVFQASPLADESLRYTGKMPKKFFGLNVLRSWQVPANTAIVLMRRKVGFISDERPMRATPLYEDRPRETWRADFTRRSVVGIDNPKAAVIITAID